MDTLHLIKRLLTTNILSYVNSYGWPYCIFLRTSRNYLAFHLRILFNQRASKMSSYFEKSYFKKTRKCIVMAKNDLVCAKNGISIVVCSTKDCADRTSMILLIVIPSLFENI